MQLYAGSSTDFITATAHDGIVGQLQRAFEGYYREPAKPAEIQSWRNSLKQVSQVFRDADLTDHGVLLEYQLPLTSSRLDCLICGHDAQGQEQAVIIELKQWSSTEPSAGTNEVVTWLDGKLRDVLHPSAQVGQYRQYLRDVHTAFNGTDAAIGLQACAYLHNYHFSASDSVLDPKFTDILQRYPIYGAGEEHQLQDYLTNQLSHGRGLQPLQRITQGRYAPARKLLEHIGKVMRENQSYVLLDDQLLVYDQVFASVLRAREQQRKTAILVKGGPGTGKSVIALHLLPDLLKKKFVAHYATGSKAFTETLRGQFGTRSRPYFTYFNGYQQADENAIDVLICDEAHRIRETSADWRTPANERSGLSQVQELLRAAWVTVFFLDDFQRVRPGEIGSYALLKQQAEAADVDVVEYTLEAQFRCNGSGGYINWLDNTLGIRRTPNILWNPAQGFDFRILDSPQEIEELLAQRRAEGATARMVAGFCWPWSNPHDDGTLPSDVTIEVPGHKPYRRPWNAQPNAGRLAPGIPKASLWATQPGGANQVGCVYTAQGFEFDYVGVILGPDLVYRFEKQAWEAQPQASHDRTVVRGTRSNPEQLRDYLRNSYKVLMTRGMKGCYVYFVDEESKRFFQGRMESF